MNLPNADRAVVDEEKLVGYCLSPDHPRGRHKARVFASALGITRDQAGMLRESLLDAALAGEVVESDADQYGQRFVLDFIMEGPAGQARVRSCWIIRTNEDFPRLTTCFVL